ncbi:restriction endonuclease subunit S [Gardnerella piotii]|uniref:restriction endonuclease subunit S n=1 Tax=Gardnerella piotii TaxID=2792977 RepID=UPI0039EF94EC
MELSRIRLGKYIELYSEKCNIPNLSSDSISGVNKDKEFFEPSNQVGSDTSKYKIVPPKYFACNLMHVGRDIVLPIAYNHSQKNKVISPAYQVFKFLNNEELLSEYFFLYLKSYERDRYFWFNTDSSVRDGMSWNDFVNIEIPLPPLAIQQKYVDVYNAMVANQKAYERGLDDLKLTCDAYIEDLRRKMPSERIGKYIIRKNDRNIDKSIDFVMGLSTKKEFREAQSRVNKNDLGKYKVVNSSDFAFVPTTDTWKVLAFALNTYEKDIVVSPIYEVFKVNKEKLIPQYLAMWLSRKEFDRYARFHSWGSARENFSFEDMQNVRIPIPSLPMQQSIVDIYAVYKQRQVINEKLKSQIKDICPILIKGSIEEGINSKEA